MKRYDTAEAVTEGHPDKLCDLIADSILDACLKEDTESRAACEVLAAKGNILVAGIPENQYHGILLTVGFVGLISCTECRIIPLSARTENDVLRMLVYFERFLMK